MQAKLVFFHSGGGTLFEPLLDMADFAFLQVKISLYCY